METSNLYQEIKVPHGVSGLCLFDAPDEDLFKQKNTEGCIKNKNM